jgi:superoxide reductase
MKYFVCKHCGYVAFDKAPAQCPVCGSPQFNEQADAIKDASLEGKEKHVPVITVTKACGLAPDACRDIHVKIGSVVHPMQEDHWITWIDAYVDRVFAARYSMKPQNLQPIISLHLKKEVGGKIQIVENCNKHGRWMAEAAL